MKKNIFFVILILLTYNLSIAQNINFPDSNFKTKLLQCDVSGSNPIALNLIGNQFKIDSNSDGQIEQSEALEVSYLFLYASNISDLTGIEYFTNIQYLGINNNSISVLNLTTLTHLIGLRCDLNNLTTINLNGHITFENLQCNNNNITSLDFTGLPNIKSVNCKNNLISSLNFSSNPLLNQLYCSNNNLTSLNIKNGINHDFSNVNYNDCWKTGNPNLITICADASEVVSVQNFLDGCGTSQAISITSNCGLGNEEFAGNITVYPNPFVDRLTIDSSQSLGDYSSITIYNTLGSVVFSNSILTSINEIDLSNLSKGVYILRLLGDSKKTSVKLIKN
jgi:hypothetical protein